MVVMNWLRPEVLQNDILPNMVKYELLDEIIISHGREDTYFEFDDPKIVNRKDWGDINEYYGLSRRFLASSEAKTAGAQTSVLDHGCSAINAAV